MNKRPLKRASGVLLHPSSLPGPYGHGDFGPSAYRFVDWLEEAGQHIWQVLPFSPPGPGDSPYMAVSTMAGNLLFVSPQKLVEAGLLKTVDIDQSDEEVASWSVHHADFTQATEQRTKLLAKAAQTFFDSKQTLISLHREFDSWCESNARWIDDYALFMSLAEAGLGTFWSTWPDNLRFRDPGSLALARKEHRHLIEFWKFVQWQFDRQWSELREYAHDRDIILVGDIPMYCAFNSVDTWCHPELFQLDDALMPVAVAGVPPDHFSDSGQYWGNPLYQWSIHAADGYSWWIDRMRRVFDHVDLVRIDHFRALESYWSIPAHENTASLGQWQPGPGKSLLQAMRDEFGELPVFAEDLGDITPEVYQLRDAFELPGTCVLQFAFKDEFESSHLPHNLRSECVLYTGTHDNDTSVGWYASSDEEERHRVRSYLHVDGCNIQWDLIRTACASQALMAIYPLQDVLGLDNSARMNVPGVDGNQWAWRFSWDQIEAWHTQNLLDIALEYSRHQTKNDAG